MKLGILDRITLLRILPSEGNYITQSIVMDFKSKLPLSEEEYVYFELVELPDGRVKWGKDEEREIECGNKMKEIIITTLKNLDNLNKLDDGGVLLYKKFIIDSNVC